MSRWFRHYAGMMRDDKLVSTAIRAKQPIERIVWVWGAILESASEIDDGGIYRLDCAEVAYFLRADEADIRAVVDALAKAGRVAADRVVKWGDRQFQSDRSAERQARYRDKKRGQVRGGDDQPPSGDAVVTGRSRHGDAPEADTELEAENRKTQPTAQHQEPAAPRDENLIEKLATAAGIRGNPPQGFALGIASILGLLERGYDLELDILPAIRGKPKPDASSPAYFVKQIVEYAEKRRGTSVKPPPPEMQPDRWRVILDHFRATGDWNRDALGPKPGEPNCRVPPELVAKAA